MSAKSSKRASSPLNQIFGAPDADETNASFTASVKHFIADYYRPLAVLVAILLLLGAAFFIYQRIKVQNMQLAAQMLKDAETLDTLDNPELIEKIRGTSLEFDWQLKRLEKLFTKRLDTSSKLDIETFLEEAAKFIDKYPRTGAAAEMSYISAIYHSYIAEFDKAIALFEKVTVHPKAGAFKEMAEKELAALKDYKADPDLDPNFRKAFEEYAKVRLATPTPQPTPGEMPQPSIEPVPIPSAEPVPLPSAEPVDINPTPAPTPEVPDEPIPEPIPEPVPTPQPEPPEGN